MPIVDGGRRIDIGTRVAQYTAKPQRKKGYLMRVGRKYLGQLTVVNDAITQVETDLAVVRNHFGLNISDSLKAALHLTANAIREGRFNVA